MDDPDGTSRSARAHPGGVRRSDHRRTDARPPVLVPILLYHSISDHPPSGHEPWTVSPASFAEHLAVIVASGRKPVTIGELVALLRAGRGNDSLVAVTFDDGWADFTTAVELLDSSGAPSTLYATSGFVGRREYLSRAQLQDVAAAGVEIGAHGVTHQRLDEVRGRELRNEVERSKAELEEVLQRPITTFAYPHGNHVKRTKSAVIEAGYQSAAAVKNAFSHLDDDLFALARITVLSHTTASTIAQFMSGEGASRAPSHERLRTRGYRYWRNGRRVLRPHRSV